MAATVVRTIASIACTRLGAIFLVILVMASPGCLLADDPATSDSG